MRKKKAMGVRGEGADGGGCGQIARSSQKNLPTRYSVWSARQAKAALSTQPIPFPHTAVCSNQRITGRSDQTGSGSERAAVGVEALVGGIVL